MTTNQRLLALVFAALSLIYARAQTNTAVINSPPILAITNASSGTNMVAVPEPPPHTNTAIIPVPRPEPKAQPLTEKALNEAKNHPGKCDIAFIGDSITSGWLTRGSNTWHKYYDKRKVLDLGVSGDRTQHVLWRYEHG